MMRGFDGNGEIARRLPVEMRSAEHVPLQTTTLEQLAMRQESSERQLQQMQALLQEVIHRLPVPAMQPEPAVTPGIDTVSVPGPVADDLPATQPTPPEPDWRSKLRQFFD